MNTTNTNITLKDIIIKRARPENAEELLCFLKIIGGETDNLTFGAEGLPISPEEEQNYLAALEFSSSSAMFIARKNGKIVGNAHFTGMTRQRLMHRGTIGISVLQSEWGQGIGGRLMENVINFAKNTAHTEIISLEVKSDNTRAIKLYRKFGFETIGHFKGFLKIDGKYADFDLMNLYLA